jgi:hypothetical protein
MLERAVHTSQGRKRKYRIFEPSRAFDTPLTSLLKNRRFLCRSRPRSPKLLKAALNDFVAEGPPLDDPRDLTEETAAQIDFYTHRGLDNQGSSIRPGALTPDTPPRSLPQEHGWTPRVGIGRGEILLVSDLTRLTLGLDQGSTLIYASFVKRPHESSAT